MRNIEKYFQPGVITIAVLLGLAFTPLTGHALPITAGDTVRIDFDLTGQTPAPPYTYLSLLLEFGTTVPPGGSIRDGDLWDVGESFDLSYFDAAGSQVHSFSFSNPFGFSVDNVSTTPLLDSPLTTASGYILMSNIVGSFELIEDDVWVSGWASGAGPVTDLVLASASVVDTAPVPEPASILLIGTGLLGLAGLGKKKFFKE